MKISVIIPTKDHWNLTNQRLIELSFLCKDKIDELILIDDGSFEEFSFLAHWRDTFPCRHFVYDRNLRNRGFGFSMNSGAARSSGDILVFLSNDVEIKYDFTEEIVEIISNNIMSLVGHRLIDYPAGWNEVNGKVIPYLEGYFLACHKSVWEFLGGFDPLYEPYCFEDIDLSMTCSAKGVSLVKLQRSNMHHLVGQTATYTESRAKITERNKKRFIKKWFSEEC